MPRFLKKFLKEERGAVTVDWVVLCAGVVAIAAAIVASMRSGAVGLGDKIAALMSGWTF